jgi:hypothetical protein
VAFIPAHPIILNFNSSKLFPIDILDNLEDVVLQALGHFLAPGILANWNRWDRDNLVGRFVVLIIGEANLAVEFHEIICRRRDTFT